MPMYPFAMPNAFSFVSWLRLCPDDRISEDKIIGKGHLPTKNRVSIALKIVQEQLPPLDLHPRRGDEASSEHPNSGARKNFDHHSSTRPRRRRIVAEVFLGLMFGDNNSLLNLDPTWNPGHTPYMLKDFVNYALGK